MNGEPAEALVDPAKTLLEVLREDLHLTGTKHGCELGECGACAVLVNGRPVLSCLALAVESNGADITTIEGIGEHGQLHPLQDAFADWGGSQCGYCTPGIILTAKALLDRQPDATRDDIKEALSGNLCRCTGYLQIFEAVEAAQAEIRRRGHSADDARGPQGPRLRTTGAADVRGPEGPRLRTSGDPAAVRSRGPLGPRESE